MFLFLHIIGLDGSLIFFSLILHTYYHNVTEFLTFPSLLLYAIRLESIFTQWVLITLGHITI